MLKAVLFDVDNTLVDCRFCIEQSTRAAAEAMIRLGLVENAQVLYEKLLAVCNGPIDYETAPHLVIEQYAIVDPTKRIIIAKAGEIAYRRTKLETTLPCPGVNETLDELVRTLRLGVITDTPRERAIERLLLAGLQNKFEVIVTMTDTGEEKPSEKPFRFALAKLGLKPEEVLYVGDREDKDIAGAKKVGMFTCLFTYCSKDPGKSANFVINSFLELRAVIKQANELRVPPLVFRKSITRDMQALKEPRTLKN